MVCYPKRVFKNEDIDIAINVPEDEVNEFSLYILTDKETKVEVPLSAVTDGVVHFEPGDLDLLNDGIIRYELSYSIGDNDYAENTNTNLILKTPSTYSAKTAEDWYNEGYEAGLNDCSGETPDCSEAYQSGYTEGVSEQKAKLTGLTANTNMIYERTDGYDRVVVNVPTGYSQSDLDNAYDSGYTAGLNDCSGETPDCTDAWNSGYTSGYTDGLNDCTGYTQEDILNAWRGGYLSGYSAGQEACSSGDTPSSGSTSGSTEDYVPRSGSTTATYFTMEIIFNELPQYPAYVHFRNDTNYPVKTVEYRKNGGSWQTLTSDRDKTVLSSFEAVVGDFIEFRGNNESYEGNSLDFVGGYTGANYRVMFAARGNIMSLVDSTGFTTATNLVDGAFAGFLQGCSVMDAGDLLLPATTLGNNTYNSMFAASILQYAPLVLPATDLSGTHTVYQSMFHYTGIKKAPVISATTLGYGCFQRMFMECYSLTEAPDLPAATIPRYAYNMMFHRTNVSYVKCLATTLEDTGGGTYDSTGNWLKGTPTYGMFVKSPSMSSWRRGDDGIPANWTVVDAS